MKVQVIVPFAPRPGVNYNVGDQIDLDDATAQKLIEIGYVVEGELEPFENFNPFANMSAKVQPKVENKPVAKPAVTVTTKAKRKR